MHLILWQQHQPTIHPAKMRQRRRSLQIPYHHHHQAPEEARALNKTELTVSTNGSVPSSESNVWYSYQKGVFACSFEYFGLVPYTTVPNCITAHFHQWTLCKMISICITSSTTACHFCFWCLMISFSWLLPRIWNYQSRHFQLPLLVSYYLVTMSKVKLHVYISQWNRQSLSTVSCPIL